MSVDTPTKEIIALAKAMHEVNTASNRDVLCLIEADDGMQVLASNSSELNNLEIIVSTLCSILNSVDQKEVTEAVFKALEQAVKKEKPELRLLH